MYKKRRCPICKQEELVRIVYGFPSHELFEMSEQKMVKLGGCCLPIGFNRNTHYCNNCDKEIEIYPSDIIFEYNVKSAWGEPIFQLSITKDERFNVKYTSYDELNLDCITCIDVNKVLELFDKYKEIFAIEDIPMPPVLDGVENNFYFKHKRKIKRLTTFNIHYYNKQDDTSEEAKLIINMLIEIFNLLGNDKTIDYLLFDEQDKR